MLELSPGGRRRNLGSTVMLVKPLITPNISALYLVTISNFPQSIESIPRKIWCSLILLWPEIYTNYKNSRKMNENLIPTFELYFTSILGSKTISRWNLLLIKILTLDFSFICPDGLKPLSAISFSKWFHLIFQRSQK